MRDIINLDESKFKIEDQNFKFGKIVREKQCYITGKYINGSQGVDLLMAISGNERMDQAFSFHRCYTEGTTNLWQFYNYIGELCNWLAEHCPGRLFLFKMDNLNLHRSPVAQILINSFGHCIDYPAPYWLCDGAIEYVFNINQKMLQMNPEGVDNIHSLVNKINGIVGDMTSFKPYFIHVCFPDY
jgi:hypothetical protein